MIIKEVCIEVVVLDRRLTRDKSLEASAFAYSILRINFKLAMRDFDILGII